MGSISIRKHIKWGSDDPSEPTSTLVLTSPGRHFVDIRILKTAPSAPQNLESHHLDWAFGGTSSTSQVAGPDGTQVSHSKFNHWVDSRTKEPEEAVDEGDMLPQPDGSTLETGRMINPATGIDTEYEESWTDEEPLPVQGRSHCSVLRLHEDTQGRRGLFVQLGKHAQGVLRTGDDFIAERWAWDESKAGWRRLFRVGSPDGYSLEDLAARALRPTLKREERLETSSGTWTVLETS